MENEQKKHQNNDKNKTVSDPESWIDDIFKNDRDNYLANALKNTFEKSRKQKEKEDALYNEETKRLSKGIEDPYELIKIKMRKNPGFSTLLDQCIVNAKRQTKEMLDLALKIETKKLATSREHYDDALTLQAGAKDNMFVISIPVTPQTRRLGKQTLELFEILLRNKSKDREINIDIKSNEETLHLIIYLDDFFNLKYLRNLFEDFVDLCNERKEISDVYTGDNSNQIAEELKALHKEIKNMKPQNTIVQVNGNVTGDVNIQQNCNNSSITNSRKAIKSETPDAFKKLQESIEKITDQIARNEIARSASEMEQAHGSSDFLQKYQTFIACAANHMGILAPVIPSITALLR